MYQSTLPILAIIVPCHNEEQALQCCFKIFLNCLNELILNNKISHQSYICFVDDGSTDNTWYFIKELSQKYNSVKGLRTLFNIGHQRALVAGISENKADIYITIDCDLQDDINIIQKMIDLYMNSDIDIVYSVRNSRKYDCFIEKFMAYGYYYTLKLLGIKSLANHADFRLISDNAANVIRNLNSKNIYLRGFLYSLNFRHKIIYYERQKRVSGESAYTIHKRIKLAIDGILEDSTVLSSLILIISLITFILSIINHSLIMFMQAVNFFIITILSIYVIRSYSIIKTNSNCVISEKINFD